MKKKLFEIIQKEKKEKKKEPNELVLSFPLPQCYSCCLVSPSSLDWPICFGITREKSFTCPKCILTTPLSSRRKPPLLIIKSKSIYILLLHICLMCILITPPSSLLIIKVRPRNLRWKKQFDLFFLGGILQTFQNSIEPHRTSDGGIKHNPLCKCPLYLG